MLPLVIGAISLVLGLIALAATGALLYSHLRDVALAVLVAPAILGVVVIVTSEAISLGGAYTKNWLLILGWSICVGVSTIALRLRILRTFLRAIATSGVKAFSGELIARIIVIIIVSIGLATFATGVLAAPNNIDSLSYHLPRIMQWLQANRIGVFNTPYPAQVYLAPGAEEIDAVLLSMFRSDHVMFLTQWVSWCIIGLAVYVTCRRLSARRTSSLLAMLIVMAAPAVVGEAATTQNDLVATAFIAIALALLVAASETIAGYYMIPIAIAASVAVKPPIAIFAVPLMGWFGYLFVRKVVRRKYVMLGISLFVGLSLNAGWMIRNADAFGSVLGPDVGLTVKSDYLQAMLSNGVKNIGNEIGVPGPAVVNRVSSRTLAVVSQAVSGASPDDARYSYTAFSIDSQRNEDRASNILQMVLIAIGAGGCLLISDLRRRTWPVMLTMLAGYLAYSSVIKYQVWGGRLMLPILVFGSVLTGVLVGVLSRRIAISAVVAILCCAQAIPWVVAQKWRPLIGSESVLVRGDYADYTASLSPAESAQISGAITAIRAIRPSSVGLAGRSSYAYEYIWWRYLDSTSISHVNVNSLTPNTEPEVILFPWDAGPGEVAGYRSVTASGIPIFLKTG